jgi:hypothetical protein
MSPTFSTVKSLRCEYFSPPNRPNERRVRSLIAEALATGQLTGPDGGFTTWQLRSAAPDNVRPAELDHAADLIAHGLDA